MPRIAPPGYRILFKLYYLQQQMILNPGSIKYSRTLGTEGEMKNINAGFRGFEGEVFSTYTIYSLERGVVYMDLRIV